MTLPTPADRTISIDDNTPSLLNFTPLIVGDPGGIGGLEAALHELTGPGHSYPVHLPAGFTRAADITLTFQADVGGSSPADPTTAFYVNRGTSRTITVTYITNWTFSTESYIASATPSISPEQLGLLTVVFRPTGTITVT